MDIISKDIENNVEDEVIDIISKDIENNVEDEVIDIISKDIENNFEDEIMDDINKVAENIEDAYADDEGVKSEDVGTTAYMDTTTEGTRHKLTRKTQRNPKSWKKNIRKHLRDAGKSYISPRNKLVPAKQVVSFKDCAVACKFNCGDQLSDERRGIFNHYSSLDKNGKTAFIASTTRAISTKRPDKKIENTRRLESMEYFFFVGGKSIRVCKPFLPREIIHQPTKGKLYL